MTKKTRTINHYHQPTGNTCGPACIFMTQQSIKNPDSIIDKSKADFMIEEIAELCETDWVVGTPPERMSKGMRALGLKFVEYQSSPRPYELLKETINNGNIPIIRTITQGVPHWIIIEGYSDTSYDVLDPWLGVITYNESELDSIWEPRYYQFYEVLNYL
jgi:ABC-type bacteriocin/lantibiotic exporter with double-glycine peptidase domain